MAEKQKRDITATREALLRAAKELMTQCSDSDEVTSRAVAARAGVNLAMINYCFGSREVLLYEVFKQLLEDAQNASPELARAVCSELVPRERVILVHYNMMRLMLSHFNYSKAITRYILLNRTGGVGMESLPCIIEHFAGRKTEDECRLISFELSSLHELAVLRHEELKAACGLDLTDDKVLKDYVRTTTERYLD
ncbi:MAG: TetR/AcrR family transcriptional regulator [Ruminococcus sp.]|nr:TetR/AcrR family transcriptional regulator [Ruminococcus sp.]